MSQLNNPALKYSDVLLKAIKPLSKLKVSQFNYERIYADGSRACLDTTPEAVIANFVDIDTFSQLYTPNAYGENQYLYIPSWVESLESDTSDLLKDSLDKQKHQADRDNEFVIIQRRHDHFELFVFATAAQVKGFLNSCINNLSTLHAFSRYFVQCHQSLIVEADQQRIIPPWREVQTTVSIKQPPQHYFTSCNEPVFLTQREAECAALLVNGKTAKLISQALYISPRTAETHIKNIKKKFHCHNKSELIALLQLNGV